MKFFIFVTILLLTRAYAHTGMKINSWALKTKQDMRVEFTVPRNELKSTVQHLKSQDFDVTYVQNSTGVIHLLLNQEDFSSLKKIYPQISVKSSRYVTSGPDEEYKTYEEIQEIIRKIQNDFPDLIHIEKIGNSLEGREIIAVRISDDKEFNEEEPAVLFNALHHAREVMTVEVIQDILESLSKGYSSDDSIRSWVDKMQIWLIPMVNPDGSNKVWTSDTMWRKNTRNNIGVDINRNYPFKWGECGGSSSNTRAQDYRGPSPASEPETQVMMSFIGKIKPVYNISYHSYGEMVIHPYGCRGNLPDPIDQVVETGKILGNLVKHVVGASWQILYDVDGGDIDWMYGVHHVIPFVLEVSKSSDGFQPSYDRRDSVVLQNRVGWKYILAKVSGVGMPRAPTTAPTQRPITIRWGGQWFKNAKKSFFANSKSIMFSNDNNYFDKVRIKNSSGRLIIEHPLLPTKETQHYMLTAGSYNLQVVSSRGIVLSQKNFVITSSQNSSIQI